MAAAHQPPETPKTLVTLPDDLALEILGRVPCKDDRASMSLVCKAWRAMVARLSARPPPPLPWLLLPSRFRSHPTFRAACVLSGSCCVHPHHNHLSILPLLLPGARFVGSYDGTWIFLHYGGPTRAHGLLNLRTRQSVAIPSSFLRSDGLILNGMFILAATLSSSPNDPSCIGAAIVVAWRDPDPYAAAMVAAAPPSPRYRRFLAFWRMGWAVACEMALGGAASHHPGVYDVEDVVHHGGAFNVLVNYGDHILVCTQAEPVHQGTWGWMKSELLCFRPDDDERIYGQFVRARHIVASRGELLKVMRWKPRRGQPTSSMFKVFRATKRPQMPDDADFPVAEFPWAWSELDTLDGRILFVGYGCSRSYDADQYPGIEAGIYFFDDGESNDEGVFFRDHNVTPYPCSDNGKYSGGHVQSCFPTTDPSDYSPPAWLLP